MQCRFCESTNTKKFGFSRKTVQRYFCKSCQRTSNEILDLRGLSKDEIVIARDLRSQGLSIRVIAKKIAKGNGAVTAVLKTQNQKMN